MPSICLWCLSEVPPDQLVTDDNGWAWHRSCHEKTQKTNPQPAPDAEGAQ